MALSGIGTESSAEARHPSPIRIALLWQPCTKPRGDVLSRDFQRLCCGTGRCNSPRHSNPAIRYRSPIRRPTPATWNPRCRTFPVIPTWHSGQRTFYRFFDTSVFSAPPQDVKGNAGQGIIRSYGQNNWDASFSKVFHPVEKSSVEFRAELFNVFNHTQWSGINRTYTTAKTSTFGWVTGARDARIAQLSLKISF